MRSAIMNFGEVLQKACSFSTAGKGGPTFAWASPGDIVILGPVPEDITGRVCSVELKGEQQECFVRVFPAGNKLRLYYMDDYDLYAELAADDVEVRHEVLGVVHLYDAEAEAPKASTAWEKRVKKAVKGRYLPLRDYGQIFKRHTDAGNWATLNVAYCLGVEAGKKEALQNDKG